MKIYLDAGHGGSDSGATGNGLLEKDLTLKIVRYIRDYLKTNYQGHSIKLSRNSDLTKSLNARTNEANKWNADILVSVHINAFNGSASGYEDFVFDNLGSSSKSPELQNEIHKEVSKLFKTNRGKKKANFHMLRESNAYAVLTENGFIDNRSDSDYLKKDSNLKEIGEAHAVGIAKFLGLKTKNKKPPSNSKKFYRVVTGSFKDKSNAVSRFNNLDSKGFNSFLDYHEGFYRVVTGSFADRKNAENQQKKLKEKGFDSFLVAHKK